MPLDTFNSGAIHPSDVSFRAISLQGNITLQWPDISTTTDDVVARTMEVQSADDGIEITLPDASQVSPGEDILFRNTGEHDITINDNDGNSIAVVNAGQVKYFYLTSNSSAAGAWGVVQFGVGSSSADASSLAGFGIKAIGTTLNQKYDVVETTSDVSITTADRAKLYVWTGGSHTLTLPTAASVGDDFFFLVKNAGAGTITANPSGDDTIDGSASLLIQPNDGVIFYSGGNSNIWYTVAQGRSVQFAFTQLVKNIGGVTADVVLTSSEAQNKVLTFTGTLVQDVNIVVPDTVSVYYIYNNTTGPFSLTVSTASGSGVAVTQGAREIAVCDGSDVRRGVDNTSATTLFSQGSEGAPSITFVTDPDTGMFHPSANQVGITGGGTEVMRFSGVASAINSFEVFPSVSGDPVRLSAIGGDTNIGIWIDPVGNGKVYFDDIDLVVRDSADTTKEVQFDVSGVATNTRRTVEVPDADGVMVLDSSTQTLSNKTLESATFTGSQPKESLDVEGNVSICPAGVILPFAGTTEPEGWLFCFGQEVSRAAYPRLYSVIGTTYGAGNGVSTFNLPDMRGRVAAGRDDMGGEAAGRLVNRVSGAVLGAAGGVEEHVITLNESPNHNHPLHDPGHTHIEEIRGGTDGGPFQWPTQGRFVVDVSLPTRSSTTGITLDPVGGDQPHTNLQPSLVLNHIIKV